MAVKLHGVLAFASICLALLVVGGARELHRMNRRTLLLVIFAFVAGAWPYFYAWGTTQNPVFPHFNGIFKSPLYPPENFGIDIYPGGISLGDYFDLTFSSHKYAEGNDGAGGFAIPLLLPAVLVLIALKGSRPLRFVAFAALSYCVLVLINIRYLRYLFPVFPLLMLVLVYPLAIVKRPHERIALLIAAIVGTTWGLVRIPAAGWILARVDLPVAFSAAAKEKLADFEVPARKAKTEYIAQGDDDSRVVIFGSASGADIRGRPLYTGWYYPKLQAEILRMASPERAARCPGGSAYDAHHLR